MIARPATRYGRLALVAALPALITAIVLFILSLMAADAAGPVTAEAAAPEELTVLRSDSAGLVVEIVPPALERLPVATNQGPREALRLAGYGRLAQPGQPDLPEKRFWVALPPGAVPEVTILAVESEQLPGVAVAPAAEQVLVDYEAGNPAAVPEFEERYWFDAAVYAQEALFPAEIVALDEIIWLRDQRIVPLVIRPVQVNPSTASLTRHTRLRLQVDFSYPNGRPPTAAPRPESDAFESVYRHQLVNYEAARDWRAPLGLDATPQPSPCLDGNAYRITLKQTGMYRLTHAQLAAAGFPVSAGAAGVRMCHMNEEIAIHLDDADQNGNFNSGDAIIFYGQAIKTQETETNVYWLTYGGATGLRMATAASQGGSATIPSTYAYTIHLEKDERYYSRFPMNDTNDHWYYSPIASNSAGTPTTLNAPFTVNNKAAGDVTVKVELWGHAAYVYHEYEVRLNGTVVGTGSFTDNASGDYPGSGIPHYFEATVAGSALLEGSNTVSVKALDTGTNHFMLVNWFQVTPFRQYVAVGNRIAFAQATTGTWQYSVSGFSAAPFIYNVTDPFRPIRITGATGTTTISFVLTDNAGTGYEMATTGAMLAPETIVKDTSSNLASTTNRADHIIITAPGLSSALTPLVNHRTAQGLVVKTVMVQDIFDEFNYGLYDASAIRNFLAYAFDNWQAPAPTYVLLAGEGSYDHRNVKGLNGTGGNLVPVYLRSGVDYNWGETVADNQYVAIVGNDDLADMLLGRLPGYDTAELTTMVNKIIAYEGAAVAPWQARHYFLTDNYLIYQAGACVPDAAGNFFATVNNFVNNHFPIGRQYLSRTYFAPVPCYPEPRPAHYSPTALDVTNRFIEQYRLGNQFVIYTGHSAIESWGHERYVLTTTVPLLTNGDKTPIMLPMTCLEGMYHRPEDNSVSEALLKSTVGGAVASYAPTGLQVRTGHEYLLVGFYGAVYGNNVLTIGEAVMGAKTHLHTSTSAFRDLQDTFMLLGDPAMRFNNWRFAGQSFLPTVRSP